VFLLRIPAVGYGLQSRTRTDTELCGMRAKTAEPIEYPTRFFESLSQKGSRLTIFAEPLVA